MDKKATSDKSEQGQTRAKKDMDFGWFKLPAAEEHEGRNESPGAVGMGGLENDLGLMEEVAPPGRASSQAHSPVNGPCGTADPDVGSRCPPSRGPQVDIGTEEADRAYDRINNTTDSRDLHPPVDYPENVVVDWPLSRVGVEQTRRCARAPAEEVHEINSRPSTAQQRDIPSTPLPPIHWQGYKTQDRPTYKTWRQNWHLGNQCSSNSSSDNTNNNNNNYNNGGGVDENNNVTWYHQFCIDDNTDCAGSAAMLDEDLFWKGKPASEDRCNKSSKAKGSSEDASQFKKPATTTTKKKTNKPGKTKSTQTKDDSTISETVCQKFSAKCTRIVNWKNQSAKSGNTKSIQNKRDESTTKETVSVGQTFSAKCKRIVNCWPLVLTSNKSMFQYKKFANE